MVANFTYKEIFYIVKYFFQTEVLNQDNFNNIFKLNNLDYGTQYKYECMGDQSDEALSKLFSFKLDDPSKPVLGA